MEDNLITQNSQSVSVSSVDNNQAEIIEQKQAELIAQEIRKESQETVAETEITREQLAISKKLLNWRTLIPLLIVIVAIIYFIQKSNINFQQTWSAIHSANIIF